MPYYPETNGQYERFNQILISMSGTLESDDKQFWKDYLPTLVHAYKCTKNNTMDFSPYYLMYGYKPMSPKTEEHSHQKFLARLSAQL